MVDAKLIDVPVVEWSMVLELQGANGMCDAFDRVRLAMGPIVHRVNAPLVAGAVVLGVHDAVHNGIAHVEIGGVHVDLGAQGAGAIGKFPCTHAPK